MNATEPKSKLTKTQQEILDLLKVPGERLVKGITPGVWRLHLNGAAYKMDTIRPIFSELKRVAGSTNDPIAWCYDPPESDQSRIAAERLADRNRRWWNALRETAPSVIGARWESITENDNGMKSAIAAVFDAIASEASNYDQIPDLLKR